MTTFPCEPPRTIKLESKTEVTVKMEVEVELNMKLRLLKVLDRVTNAPSSKLSSYGLLSQVLYASLINQ